MATFCRRLLKIDLTNLSFSIEEPEDSLYSDYLGGRGLGTRIMTREDHHLLDPLSAEAAFVVAAGPLSGTRAPGAGRLSISAVSPLTNTLFDCNSGGFFGQRLKGAGFDAVVVTGRAEKPTGVLINPQGVLFFDAAPLWGFGNDATEKAIEASHGAHYTALTIGPAGENGSLLANVCHSGRFFGRGGLGAVWGAKNLKALCAAGDFRPKPADPEKFSFIVNESRKLLAAHPITSKGLKQFGTAVMMNLMNQVEALPVANFRENTFSGADRISGEALRDNLLTSTHACPGCPIGCGRKVDILGKSVHGPEFETLWSFGANLKNEDLYGISRINALANDLGLDTVSAGSTIAAAKELFDRGFLEFDPLSGGVAGILDLLEGMAKNSGRGAQLKDGSAHLAKDLGAPECSMTVKGLEIPAYDPRGIFGQALAYATSNRGGCHMRSYMVATEILASPKLIDRFASQGKAGLVIVSQNLNAATDSLVMCRFMSFALKDDYYARLLKTATGLQFDAQSLMTVGERIYNLERLANIGRGFGRGEDTLPERLLNDPVGSGPAMGRPVPLTPMLQEYYRFRGWDQEGCPTPKKLSALGLA